MPRVKFDYIVSFSSEDPDYPARNLLAWEVDKKKRWLCKKGQPSCSVVIQLTKAVKICSIHIGAYHSAFVEVLVARSERGAEQYQVLVPSCVLVPLAESRAARPVERVRSFSGAQLSEEARAQCWDRVRVVCSQPYNRHCQYGLSFVHVDESGEDAPSAAAPPGPLALDTYSSEEEEFRPGELFARHHPRPSSQAHTPTAFDTGAQIRQATSQALKNIAEPSTKLVKTPINKPKSKGDEPSDSDRRPDRSREALLYTREDRRLPQRHKEEGGGTARKDKGENEPHGSFRKQNPEGGARKRRMSETPPAHETPPKKIDNKRIRETCGTQETRQDGGRRRRSSREDPAPSAVKERGLLAGVVLVLSGYQNPERARLRDTALALGARVQRDWGPTCTHLLCAFPNTPKLRQVRAERGALVPVVRAEWLQQCARRGRRLPWEEFATEPSPSSQPAPPTPDAPFGADCDTDEEIEKVLRKQKQKRDAGNDDSPDVHRSPVRASVELEEPSTEEEERDEAVPRLGGALPAFLEGHTVGIDARGGAALVLSRYVRAYGGLALQASELDEETGAEYIVRGEGGEGRGSAGGALVSAAWLACCHRAGALLPH